MAGTAARPDVVAKACMSNCTVDAKVISMLPDFARNAHGNLAEQNRLATKTIRTMKSQRGSAYSELPIEMNLSGDFAGFYEFMLQLERLPRLDGRELNFAAYVTTAARNASYDAIELNLSCPNVHAGGMEFGADPRTLTAVVARNRLQVVRPLVELRRGHGAVFVGVQGGEPRLSRCRELGQGHLAVLVLQDDVAGEERKGGR